MSATATVTLEDKAKEYSDLQTQRNQVEGDLIAATADHARLEDQRKSIMVRIADGDVKAGAQADQMEQQQVHLERKIEGLQTKISQIETQFREVSDQLTVLGRERQASAAAERLEELKTDVAHHTQKMLAHWRAGCRAAYELTEFLAGVEDETVLSPSQKSKILTMASEVLDVGGAQHNEGWTHHSRSVGGWQLTIKPVCPPESLRHLEKLEG